MVCLLDPTENTNQSLQGVFLYSIYTPCTYQFIFSEGLKRQTMTQAPVILPSGPILV